MQCCRGQTTAKFRAGEVGLPPPKSRLPEQPPGATWALFLGITMPWLPIGQLASEPLVPVLWTLVPGPRLIPWALVPGENLGPGHVASLESIWFGR